MNFDLIVKIILLAINLTGFVLFWWVVRGDSDRRLKTWFSLMTITILIWSDFSYLGSISPSVELAQFLYKINWAAVAMFLAFFFYFFVVYFLNKGKFVSKLGLAIFIFSIFLAMATLLTDLVIAGAVQKDWGMEVVFGPLSIVFYLYSALVAGMVIYFSLQSYKKLEIDMRRKLKYFLAGVFSFIIANIIFNIGSQLFFTSVQYQFLGDFSAIFLLGFTAYAIVKHELFDIKVIATEALTFIVWLILLSKLFISQSTEQFLVDLTAFLLTVIFGIMLIRSVSREVKQKERLEELNQKLQELDEQKDEFINVAAHELRAPMTAIKGFLSMVQEGDTGEISEKTREFILDAINGNERLIRLVNNMLNIARIEEGRMVFDMGTSDLKDVASEVVKNFGAEADSNNLALNITIQPNLLSRVYVDRDRIYEVISNFVSNAVKYTEKGSVTVKLTNPNSQTVRFECIDTGVGVTVEEQQKLFKKFERAKSSAGKTIGTGLGLYISKLLIEKFRGRVGLVSEYGKGSNFWFDLPIYEKDNPTNSPLH